MSFDPNSRLDTSQVSDRRGGGGFRGGGGSRRGGGLKLGGGLGGLVVVILVAVFFGPEALTSIGLTDDSSSGRSTSSGDLSECRTGQDANEQADCRVVGTVNSLNAFWQGYLPDYGISYRAPEAALENGQWDTGCGVGNSEMGPFYCPSDETAYFDTDFFQVLKSDYGSSGGPLAEEYVVAHEWGHHIQNLTGTLGKAQQDPQGEQSGAVRVELQADCYAGLWAAHAATTNDPETGKPYLEELTEQDVSDALSAAAAVGDDRIQQKAQGRVTPESWTHGSAEQRQKWFIAGYTSGDLAKCDTFAVDRV
ncbi:neutral zinc metallopeptidase [Saxibacter everestensis]|uniref:Neutral zinc metallopeptidase n=1 Tax=Saxibacter everestensis TaxID=2909229 RepID=A0ABY8QXP3_9MICO|nr:neutral zinc metallopeptidase [Brevibacteriaceae bacterium ZFBP1038]